LGVCDLKTKGSQNNMARICSDLRECAEHIRNGELVSFPTETVYGLGANALDEQAILKIFHAKQRPLTDPVIVHVASQEDAVSLIDEDDSIEAVYSYLCCMFWPGPLTLVAKAAPEVSPLLTANSGFVGIRSPSHPIALDLIKEAGTPIAAPSANMFSHVSPTCANHVINDFASSEFSIKVLDGGKCSFGIESTVAKLFKLEDRLVVMILRKGGVSRSALTQALVDFNVDVLDKEQFLEEHCGAEAPGQLIKHYSPAIDAFILSDSKGSEEVCSLEQVVIIDFQGRLSDYECIHRKDLSPEGKVTEAINNLYETLRWSEDKGAKCVLLPDLSKETDEFTPALFDRVFRATSGRRANIVNNKVYV